MLTNGMKVQTIQAWGWFIRLLGSHALKNRQLINQMLKIPEQTFSDHDSQVQIASQVSIIPKNRLCVFLNDFIYVMLLRS